MTAPLAYLNGQFAAFSACAVPLHDAGFVSGAAVVDNARTFGRRLFRWPDHLARFRGDCAACSVPLEASDEQLTAIAEALIAHNAALLPPGGELHVVTFATPGPLGVYLGDAANGPPTLGLATYPVPRTRYRPFFSEGATLAVVGPFGHRADGILPPTVKHRSRMAWHIADRLARDRTGNPWALALSHDGTALGETSVANFLAVFDGVVVSPPRDTVLRGISLQVTAELCDHLGIAFEERIVPLSEVARGSEVLLTGTAFGLAGVRRIDTRELAWPGPMFTRLLAAWSDRVGLDIAKSFLDAC